VLNRLGLKAGDTLEIAESEGGEWTIRAADIDFARQIQHAERFIDK
jgi:hypothetical protein